MLVEEHDSHSAAETPAKLADVADLAAAKFTPGSAGKKAADAAPGVGRGRLAGPFASASAGSDRNERLADRTAGGRATGGRKMPRVSEGAADADKVHAAFVDKVSLFRDKQLRTAQEGEAAERTERGRLVPCALVLPHGAKATPMEQQVMAIKAKSPDTVLLIECGYKFKFFGRDAEIAAKVLNIFHHMDHSFLVASIPVFRLQVHLRRLVEAGYKVGVVRQTETAALKAVSANKSKQFERKLCEVYTKSTMLVEDVDVLGEHTNVATGGAGGSVYMMCVSEETCADDKVSIGVVCVDTASGDIVYDDFQDGTMRSELAARVTHLQPRELVLPDELSSESRKLLARLTGGAQGDRGAARVETIAARHFAPASAAEAVRRFFEKQQKPSAQGAGGTGVGDGCAEMGCVREGQIGAWGAESVSKLPGVVQRCLGGLMHYLSEFKLEQVLSLTSNFWRFTSASHMALDASVLENLEVLRNQNDGAEHGSLLWLLKSTRTAFGARLLRHWVTHPLVDRARIVARHDAVQELMGDPPALEQLAAHLRGLPDLERALARVHYGKCTPHELVAVLRAFLRLAGLAADARAQAPDLRAELLRALVGQLPDVAPRLQALLDELHLPAATRADERGKPAPDHHNLLRGYRVRAQHPRIFDLKEEAAGVEAQLAVHLRDVRRLLGMPDLEYRSILTTPYLIEVPIAKNSKVPRDWLKMNGTQKCARYHSPEVQELYAKLLRVQESLDAECARAWLEWQHSVAECYPELRQMVQCLAVIDCLLSLASVAQNGGWTRPEMAPDGEHCLEIEQGRHPMVDAVMGSGFVPNSTALAAGGETAMVITGPNMGGKSSYIRQNALIVIMSQIGSFVPAEAVRMGVFDAVYTRMGAEDFIAQGRSTFMVELQEASDILRRATNRSLVIMDELGRGTSTHDGTAIAYAALRTLVEEIKCFSLFVTHYQLLCQMQEDLPGRVGNHHMSFLEQDGDRVAFMYRLVPGRAGASFGLNVALLANLPRKVVDVAKHKSGQLEQAVKQRVELRSGAVFARVMALLMGGAAAAGQGEGEDVDPATVAELRELAAEARLLVAGASRA